MTSPDAARPAGSASRPAPGQASADRRVDRPADQAAGRRLAARSPTRDVAPQRPPPGGGHPPARGDRRRCSRPAWSPEARRPEPMHAPTGPRSACGWPEETPTTRAGRSSRTSTRRGCSPSSRRGPCCRGKSPGSRGVGRLILLLLWTIHWAYARHHLETALVVLVLSFPLAANLDTGNITLLLAFACWGAQFAEPRLAGLLWALATWMKWVPAPLWLVLAPRARLWGIPWLAVCGVLSLAMLPLTIVQLQALFGFGPRPLRLRLPGPAVGARPVVVAPPAAAVVAAAVLLAADRLPHPWLGGELGRPLAKRPAGHGLAGSTRASARASGPLVGLRRGCPAGWTGRSRERSVSRPPRGQSATASCRRASRAGSFTGTRNSAPIANHRMASRNAARARWPALPRSRTCRSRCRRAARRPLRSSPSRRSRGPCTGPTTPWG